MDKKEIITRFLEIGVVIPPSFLDKIDEKNIELWLEQARRTGNVMLQDLVAATQQSAAKDQSQPAEAGSTKPEGLKIETEALKEKGKLTPADFVDYYNRKYNKLKEILLKKVKAVSIRNAARSYSDISVIGMVKEVTNSGFVIEDPTGELEVQSKSRPAEDDVVAVKGLVRNSKIFEKELVYPDIPLIRSIGSLKGSILLCKDKAEGTALSFSHNPQRSTITDGKGKITVLAYKPEGSMTLSDAILLLKKRHLSPKNPRIAGGDPYIIDPIPEILWLLSEEKFTGTYKGVKIVSFGAEKGAKVDLETKNISFI